MALGGAIGRVGIVNLREKPARGRDAHGRGRRARGSCDAAASRSTTAKPIRVERHEIPDADRRPPGHALHAVGHPVVPTCAGELGHREEVPSQVLRQPHRLQLALPLLGRDVAVRDLAVERLRVLARDPVHVLRPRTGELVDPSQMRPRVVEDGNDHASDVRRSDGIRLAFPERQLDAASVADAGSGEREEKALQEDRRPDRDDRQAGPRERLLAEPVLTLLGARGIRD
jgi:hypothetical protein